jgi:hypothetical protein
MAFGEHHGGHRLDVSRVFHCSKISGGNFPHALQVYSPWSSTTNVMQ